MAGDIKEGKLIYHLTDIENLVSIFEIGLIPRNQLNEFSDVADSEIIDSRRRLGLDNYVPFHFFAKNPFDGRVQIDHPDKKFALLTVRRAHAKAQNWKIIPVHPLAGHDIELLNYDDGFESIDWALMNTRDYKNDGCRRVCMAECLSPTTVPVDRVSSIYVSDNESCSQVNDLLSQHGLKLYLNLNSNMFINNNNGL